MAVIKAHLSTGVPSLDKVFRGLMAGDNVVWQIDALEDYIAFVKPCCEHARATNQELIYFRFAEHPPLLNENDGARIYQLNPEDGFEPFLKKIHQAINEVGRGGVYIFDCLSELAPDWCSDRMLGNFFVLTCPYLYDHAAIAYFSVMRNTHSFHAMWPITNTTQLLIDVYRRNGDIYIHPKKIQHRHSVTMYMLHVKHGDEFIPVTESSVITDVVSDIPWSRLDATSYILGYWSKTFFNAEQLYKRWLQGNASEDEVKQYTSRIIKMLISHDARVQELAEKIFTLKDILDIRKRMIGTGHIGGKAVGMLLARAILYTSDSRWTDVLEKHDSFFVGTDVFYTYLVQNECWWMVHDDSYGDETTRADKARRKMLSGEFPEYIKKQFSDMLDYFGQSPIIVRSSSLLEDNFGNAFAGKYESVFCSNQGGPHKRLEDFLAAVRTVYASMMSEDALFYRKTRGLLECDEQMALLIQRVSGASHGNLYFPQAAGVGFSFNPYVWHESIDPTAGMLRLVFGMGTRAVDRCDDDYTRIVALNAPERRPESSFEKVRQYAQRRVDVLDREANLLTSCDFEELIRNNEDIELEMFASRDRKQERELRRYGRTSSVFPWVLTFDKLLTKTNFVKDMHNMLKTIESVYKSAVDIEFTVNFLSKDLYKINLVQCRPLEVLDASLRVEMPENIAEEKIIIKSSGTIIGKNKVADIDWIIYVVPELYKELSESEKYGVAHLVGYLAHHEDIINGNIMAIGPGRWGTSMPALGVPVSFKEIYPVNIICEIVEMHEHLVPDVSLGTHFFNEMVENDMLYMALFTEREGVILNRHFLTEKTVDCSADYIAGNMNTNVVRLIRAGDMPENIKIIADTIKQNVLCYTDA